MENNMHGKKHISHVHSYGDDGSLNVNAFEFDSKDEAIAHATEHHGRGYSTKVYDEYYHLLYEFFVDAEINTYA
jgi:hypothetical protein